MLKVYFYEEERGHVVGEFTQDLKFRELIAWLKVYDHVRLGVAVTEGWGTDYFLSLHPDNPRRRERYWFKALRTAGLA